MVEFRLKLADDFHRKIKATAAMEGVTMQQMIVLALDSFVDQSEPKGSRGLATSVARNPKKSKARKRSKK